MSDPAEDQPRLCGRLIPPEILGVADLAGFAYQGNDHDALVAQVERFHGVAPQRPGSAAARLMDLSIAAQLGFDRMAGLALQAAALEQHQVFRVQGGGRPRPLRLLALAAPGDLMVNTPLDFLSNPIGVQLDIIYLRPGHTLPDPIPDHDVAFSSVSEADPAALARLRALFATWPRPALNDPALLPRLARDTLAQALSGVPGVCSPAAVIATRAALEARLRKGGAAIQPCLIRPAGSHAGAGLELAATAVELSEYLRVSPARDFTVTAFEDYSGPDGYYRKSRVAFIDQRPFLCHMAVSAHWMVHYLNAGMTESAWKREEEAHAMATFDEGFARRHAAAFAALHNWLGFDFYSIDCAETRDGRLLVFEADVAAIIHLMDPPDLFPYKQVPMHRVFAAFGDMLRRRLPPPHAATARLALAPLGA